jgi:RNA polymerase sigma factor (sigma-70 family)
VKVPAGEVDMPESAIGALLEKLRTDRASEAWTDFLALYSDQIYKTARLTTSDEETAADCYLYICEQLCREGFKRLLHFRPGGPAKFETWLAVVARNLCLDWLRRRFGRNRAFRSLENMTPIESEVFRLHVQQGLSLDETYAHLKPQNTDLTFEEVESADSRIQEALSSRQRWLLRQRSVERETVSVDTPAGEGAVDLELEDPNPSPELELIAGEDRQRLDKALARLEPEQRLLIRLRFEEELSLVEIARLTGAADAQRAHHRLNLALGELRKFLRNPAWKMDGPVRERW